MNKDNIDLVRMQLWRDVYVAEVQKPYPIGRGKTKYEYSAGEADVAVLCFDDRFKATRRGMCSTGDVHQEK